MQNLAFIFHLSAQKKTGVAEPLQAFDHAGLLFNEPVVPRGADLPFI